MNEVISEEEGRALAQPFGEELVQASLRGFDRFLAGVSKDLKLDLTLNLQSMIVTQLIGVEIENAFAEKKKVFRRLPDNLSRYFEFRVEDKGFNLRVARVDNNFISGNNHGSERLREYKAQQLCFEGMEPFPNLELGWQPDPARQCISCLAFILPQPEGVHWYFKLPLLDTSKVVPFARSEEASPIPDVPMKVKESIRLIGRRANDGGSGDQS